MMDMDTALILHDLLDIVEELTDVVRELNPGHNFELIDHLTRLTGQKVEEALRNVEPS